MRLFYSEASPFARRVRVTALEKGIDLELVATNVFDEDEQFLRINPLGKIPALITDEGVNYCDSSVICEYLDQRTRSKRLIPATPSARVAMLRRDYMALGIMEAAVRLIVESRRPEGTQWGLWVGRQEKAINRTLDAIEQELHEWPEEISLAHVTLGCALGYIDFRHAFINWRRGRGQLADWYEDVAARASMQDTAPGKQGKAA